MGGERSFDLVVIGAGPAGYVGALRAAQLGMTVACVERDRLGGVCLNSGCIPTKALLHGAEQLTFMREHAGEWGFHIPKLTVDWHAVTARPRQITEQFNKGIAGLFKAGKVESIHGSATIVAAGTRGEANPYPCRVRVTAADQATSIISAGRVMIATGASPRPLPNIPFDGRFVINAYQALLLPQQPRRIVIVGAGAIGVEFASFFRAFGAEVTLVELKDRIVPAEDSDVSKIIADQFTRAGIRLLTSHTTGQIDIYPTGVHVAVGSAAGKPEVLKAEHLLVAIGVQPNAAALFGDGINPDLFSGWIKTDYQDLPTPTYMTTLPGIYAVGDIIGPPWLAHVSSAEAVACVERMAGRQTPGVDYGSIPACTYCQPQIASIGVTEDQLLFQGKKRGADYIAGKYALASHGKAVATGENIGFVKLLAEASTGRLIGAHLVGPDVTEVIGELALARRLKATIHDIASTVHPHPTINEAIHEAALICMRQGAHQ
ncbi:MAG TPA: dihydrolipoyl dehydrogenase [Tepidisphaeraceae bacterium]|jgi:dihydrolipoamide dehydrogenase|nr:dihydrolipoyl dehydrogenase [Tepidisphaeraceae bacterium]